MLIAYPLYASEPHTIFHRTTDLVLRFIQHVRLQAVFIGIAPNYAHLKSIFHDANYFHTFYIIINKHETYQRGYENH